MLEQLFPASWLEQRAWFSFVLGVLYTVLGIASALLIFPQAPALPAVAFTSLLILPTLHKLLFIEAAQAGRELKFDLADPFRNHRDVFEVYFFLFFGVFLAFIFFALALPSIASDALFAGQLEAVGLAGQAAGSGTAGTLLANNALVFVFAFLASFIYGSGAIFVIIWNASVWGVVIGTLIRDSAVPKIALTLAAIFPHMATEASAYLLVAIAGGVISKAVIFEKLFSRKFTKVVQDGLVLFVAAAVLLVAAAYIEAGITPRLMAAFGL